MRPPCPLTHWLTLPPTREKLTLERLIDKNHHHHLDHATLPSENHSRTASTVHIPADPTRDAINKWPLLRLSLTHHLHAWAPSANDLRGRTGTHITDTPYYNSETRPTTLRSAKTQHLQHYRLSSGSETQHLNAVRSSPPNQAHLPPSKYSTAMPPKGTYIVSPSKLLRTMSKIKK